MPCLKPSLEQDGILGPDAARARPPLLVSRALRWPWRDRKDAGSSDISKVPALHREAERDTTGSFNRQPPVHTWIGGPAQGKRRRAATLRLIRRKSLKQRLTLWFYCGKRAARRYRIIGEPRKSSCFAEMCAVVRRSIALFRCHGRPGGRIATLKSASRVKSSHRL